MVKNRMSDNDGNKTDDGKKLLQAVKGWKEGGQVLQPGMRVWIERKRAQRMIKTGYAVEVSEDMPYEFPAPTDHPEFKFQKIVVGDEKGMAEKPKEKVHAKMFEKPELEPKFESRLELVPKLEPTINIPMFSDIAPRVCLKALKEAGIETLADLKGWTIEKLCTIDRVGRPTAERLIDAYTKYIVYEGKSITYNKMLKIEEKIEREKEEMENDKKGDDGMGKKVDAEERDDKRESGFDFD